MSTYSTSYNYFSIRVAISQAITINPLHTTSTGIRSAKYSPLQFIDLSTPLPAAMNRPVGPLKLSTQPGMGSFHAGITKKYTQFFNNNLS